MIADRLAREKKLQEAEGIAFWEEFEERIGRIGDDPATLYRFEIGHVLHVKPEDIGEIPPHDLMAALHFFDAMYRSN